jgi:SulP family sulfate permease
MSDKKRSFFKHYKKIYVNEFKGYNGFRLIKDMLAGMTVAAVSLPLALAFGASSVTPEYTAVGVLAGLITAVVAGLVTGALGGGSFQISGPTGTMSAVLVGLVAGRYGLQGMFLACFLAGVIRLVAGLLHLGKLIQFIPYPVVTGFTSGIAVIIAVGQLGNFFGAAFIGETLIQKVAYFFGTQLQNINPAALICALGVVLFMIFYPKKFSKYVPGSLAALIVMTAVAVIFSLML